VGSIERIRSDVGAHIEIIDARTSTDANEVEEYWTGHTVCPQGFVSALQSSRYLEWRFREYPLFREFMGLWGKRAGQVVLDYGCGPGADTVGLLTCSDAALVVAMDVSPTSIEMTRDRLMLHRVDPERCKLILGSDTDPHIPLKDCSVDHVNCGGVLHHTSHPDVLLEEFYRVLRPGGTANVMVYGYDSIYIHLFVAYLLQVKHRRYEGLSLEEAFERYADGEGCPIAACYTAEDFASKCRDAGFDTEFVGGYLSRGELGWLRRSLRKALRSSELSEESRVFLRELSYDDSGLPMHNGYHAGLSYVFRLKKTISTSAPQAGSGEMQLNSAGDCA
jgi:ubiquinone/menaquinone biosynthesis C-methylase UbiE